MHETTGAVSSSTVHPPQVPRSQISFVPVRSRCSRRASARVTRGSRRAVYVWPLTCRVIGTGSGPRTRSADCCSSAALAGNDRRAAAKPAALAPAPFKKERREMPEGVGLLLCGGLSAGPASLLRIGLPPWWRRDVYL